MRNLSSTLGMSSEFAPVSPETLVLGAWQPWFAWRPVRLYMTGGYVWLRRIHRRGVMKNGLSMCDYTDRPEEFPAPPAG
jgi:hypothetical protein